MRFYPTKIHKAFACFIFFTIIFNLGCSKDTDLLIDSILGDDAVSSVNERTQNTDSEEQDTEEEATQDEEGIDEEEIILETRTTSFSPTNDAHVQSGKGYNQNIIRLEENHRTSYLMFDLSAIDLIGGAITEVTLQFTIDSDDGNGNITVYRGSSSDWTENNLSDITAPKIDVELGSIIKEYRVGVTEMVELNASALLPEVATLVLDHKNGNDLAFASKEHTSKIGPKLVVSYEVPVGSEEISMTDQDGTEEDNTSEDGENQEPMAVADATPSAGGVPLEVSFTGNNSTDDKGISSYLWDFKDGSTSTEPNPKHTFEEIGTYEVVLTVEDEEGLTNTDTVNIKVNEDQNAAPKAIASATPTTGEAPLEVSFKASDSTDDNNVTSYSWDFKDGSPLSTEANPDHTFTTAGNYEVLLTVKDENGLTDKETITITVTSADNEAPVAIMTTNATTGEAPVTVQFTGNKSTDDKEVTSYFWDFKDGSTATNQNPSHTFDEAGTYEVELTVEDEEGLSDTAAVTITVRAAQNEAPEAKITVDKSSGEAPLQLRFNADSSTDDKEVTGYFWDFKDGRQTRTKNPSHTYEQPGIYEVELTVEDAEGLSSIATVTITVDEAASGGSTGGGTNGDYPSNAVYASSYGYNSSNATNALNQAINSSNSFIVVDKQSSNWIIEPLSLKNIRNKTIVFEEGVVLEARRGAFPDAKRLFQFINSDNVEIRGYGATFKMHKSEYVGQQNHALSYISCSNMTVKGLTLRDAGGDGIYVSRLRDGEYCSNIRIEDVIATDNQRQGITVISVDGLVVRNSVFKNTAGEYPGAGVDFEPESTRDRLANMRFENCTFKDNFGPGILFALSKTSGSSKALDAEFKNCYVSNNFSTQNITVYPTEIDLGMSTNNRTNPIQGSVVFDGLTVENSKWGAISSKKTLEAYSVTIKNTTIRNVSRSSNKAAIHIGLLSYGNTSNANMGGFTFENVLIDYDGVDPSLELFGPSHGNWNLRNLRGEVRVKSPNGIRFYDNLNKLETTNSSTVTLKMVKG